MTERDANNVAHVCRHLLAALEQARAREVRLVEAGRELADKLLILRCSNRDKDESYAATKALAMWDEALSSIGEER